MNRSGGVNVVDRGVECKSPECSCCNSDGSGTRKFFISRRGTAIVKSITCNSLRSSDWRQPAVTTARLHTQRWPKLRRSDRLEWYVSNPMNYACRGLRFHSVAHGPSPLRSFETFSGSFSAGCHPRLPAAAAPQQSHAANRGARLTDCPGLDRRTELLNLLFPHHRDPFWPGPQGCSGDGQPPGGRRRHLWSRRDPAKGRTTIVRSRHSHTSQECRLHRHRDH